MAKSASPVRVRQQRPEVRAWTLTGRMSRQRREKVGLLQVHSYRGRGKTGRGVVAKYQAEYAGLVQYYLLAQDVFRLGRLHWIMETRC